MSRMRLSIFVLLGCFNALPQTGQAAGASVGLTTGLMQQPSSQYYLATYGVYADLQNSTGKLLGRLQYTERPEFRSEGYADKDFAYFLLAGTTLTQANTYGLRGFFGLGQAEGYIKTIDEKRSGGNAQVRQWHIGGPSASAEAFYRIGRMTFLVSHITLAGIRDNEQFEARVAWPYTFFNLAGEYTF